MKSQPFRRFNALMSAAMLMVQNSGMSMASALANMPAYRSRGKGENSHNKKRNFSTMRIKRASVKNNNIRKRGGK